VELETMRRRVSEARVARLATVDPEGRPHLVPICFALTREAGRDLIVSGTDEKPKTTMSLRRLRNIRAHPAVTLLVDHYEEDWTRVWWVRVDGTGSVIEEGPEWESAVTRLREKYRQYETVGLSGAVVAIAVDRWRGWAYSEA
jgi:PPOX class probable F420-dependent enzyme